MVGFGISGVEPSGSATTVFVSFILPKNKTLKNIPSYVFNRSMNNARNLKHV
jgi:hypothetical protein